MMDEDRSYSARLAVSAAVPYREPSIGVCMLVKNEVNRIDDCLRSVEGVVDDIFIIDTGSDDGTPEHIERRYGVRVHHDRLQEARCFALADLRNKAIRALRTDWILALDADERVELEPGMDLRSALVHSREDGHFGRWWNHLPGEAAFEDYKLFLFRSRFRKRGLVHDNVQVDIRERNGHDRGFAVAGAAKTDLLADFAQAIDQVAAEGKSIDWFRQNFDEIVNRHGWAYRGEHNWRTRVIYSTNMRTSYSAGRLAQLRDPELQEVAPIWIYRHGGSQDPRPQHLAWDGKALPADDPWWERHYPPNGWGCSCYVIAVSEEQARRMGADFERPGRDPKGAIDKGWDYMPGATVADELREFAEGKIGRLPASLGSELWASMPAIIRQRQADEFARWADARIATMQPRGEVVAIGAIDPVVTRALSDRGMAPAVAGIVARDRDVIHAHRDAKQNRLPWSWYRRLPEHLPQRKAVLLEQRGDHVALLYVWLDPEQPRGRYKLVVEVGYTIKTRGADGSRVTDLANVALSGKRVQVENLRGLEVLDGEL